MPTTPPIAQTPAQRPKPWQPAGTIGAGGSSGSGVFRSLSGGSPAPRASIRRATVVGPNRGDFGSPGTTPVIGLPNRGDYGTVDRGGIDATSAAANKALKGFNDPTGTGAFKNLMGLAGEQTAAAAGEERRHAADAGQRRGYSGGFEDTARAASQDRMSALASAGFAGAQQVQQEEGAQYGRAIGAFTALQDSYNQAMTTQNVSFARDLTTTRIQQASNSLATMDLNQRQQLAYADAVNTAKQLQATLDEQFNKDQIDNNRYIQANQQIAAQLQASMAALSQRSHEFDVTSRQSDEAMKERQREFDLGLKANPNTAQRALTDPQLAGPGANRGGPAAAGRTFTGLV